LHGRAKSKVRRRLTSTGVAGAFATCDIRSRAVRHRHRKGRRMEDGKRQLCWHGMFLFLLAC